MTLHAWLTFLLASSVMLVIPGPTILLVIGQSLGAGRRHALPLVAGVALGDLTAMTLSLAGLGALLAASAGAFTVLKWAGAIYLVYLGVKLWRSPVSTEATPPLDARAAFRQAYVVTALNPKAIAFFVAFAPQFYFACCALRVPSRNPRGELRHARGGEHAALRPAGRADVLPGAAAFRPAWV